MSGQDILFEQDFAISVSDGEAVNSQPGVYAELYDNFDQSDDFFGQENNEGKRKPQ